MPSLRPWCWPSFPLKRTGPGAAIERVENGLLTAVVIKGQSAPMKLLERMAYYDVPGVSIAVIDHGQLAWAKGSSSYPRLILPSSAASVTLPVAPVREGLVTGGNVLAVCAAIVLTILDAVAQSQAPRNDLPQPYRTTRDWGQLPPGVAWAAVTAIEPAPDGAIYVIHRCLENSCAGRSEEPILKYDANGSSSPNRSSLISDL